MNSLLRASVFAALSSIPALASAQVRASELGSVSQTIDGTKITIEYSRPRSRGRDQIFGTKAVHWGETWTPGANWATTFEVSRNIKVNGKAVAKGKYSVWMIPKQSGDWTVILEPDSHRFHMNRPDSSAAQIRIPVKAEAVPFTDVLTWSFPEIRETGGTVTMEWERARIPLKLDVEPSLVTTLPASEAAQYLGEYAFTEDPTGKPKLMLVTITHENGTLKARFTPEDPYMKKFALVKIGPDWFAPGVYDEKGALYEVMKPDYVMEFKRANGKIEKFELRDIDDNMWGIGVPKR